MLLSHTVTEEPSVPNLLEYGTAKEYSADAKGGGAHDSRRAGSLMRGGHDSGKHFYWSSSKCPDPANGPGETAHQSLAMMKHP